MKTSFVFSTLVVFGALTGLSQNAQAWYHGYTACTHTGGMTEIAMSSRSSHEGLGFEGLRLRQTKTNSDVMYTMDKGTLNFGKPEAGETMTFTDAQKHAVKFTVLSTKLISNESTSEKCSFEDNMTTEATMKMDVIGDTGTASGVLTFSCVEIGFNPQVSRDCAD